MKPCVARKKWFVSMSLALASMQCMAQMPGDSAALESLENAWVQATASRDIATLDRILDPSFVETLSNGRRRDKAEALSAAPPPVGSTQQLQDMKVRTYGDTAIVTGTNRFSQSGQPAALLFSFTDVFVRRDGAWRAVSSHMTLQGRE